MPVDVVGKSCPPPPSASIGDALTLQSLKSPRLPLWTAAERASGKGRKEDWNWQNGTFADVCSRRDALAAFLLDFPFSTVRGRDSEHPQVGAVGPRIVAIAGMRPEYITIIQGIAAAGAVSVPLLPSTDGKAVARIVAETNAEIIIVENAQQVKKLFADDAAMAPGVPFRSPTLKQVIVLEREGVPFVGTDSRFIHFPDALEQGRSIAAKSDLRVMAEDLATLIYTSGTTGNPKGVMLSHGNFLSTVRSLRLLKLFSEGDRVLAVLPPAHVYMYMVSVAAAAYGITLCLPPVENRQESIQTKTTLTRMLKEADAHLIPLIPDILHRIHRDVSLRLAQADQASYPSLSRKNLGVAAKLFLGKHLHKMNVETSPSFLSRSAAVLAAQGVRSQIFGRNVRHLVSGSAKLNPDTSSFFAKVLGLRIIEGYGSTEMCAVAAVTTPQIFEAGSVGLPLHRTRVTIHDADNELAVTGPGVAFGYWRNPTATAEKFNFGPGSNTVLSGDAAKLSPTGKIVIQGRTGKDGTFKLSTGEFVSTIKLELLAGRVHEVEEVIVVGEGKPFCAAVVRLTEDATQTFAERYRIAVSEVHTDPRVVEELRKKLSKIAGDHKELELKPHEKISAVVITTIPFVRTAETRKIRRTATIEAHVSQIEHVYRSHGVSPTKTIQYRSATVGDSNAIITFFKSLPQDDQYSRFRSCRVHETVLHHQSTPTEQHRIFIAMQNGTIVGVANCIDTPDRADEVVFAFAVAPEARRQKIGVTFLQKVIQSMKEHDKKIMEIDYLAQNTAVVNLFAKAVAGGALVRCGVATHQGVWTCRFGIK